MGYVNEAKSMELWTQAHNLSSIICIIVNIDMIITHLRQTGMTPGQSDSKDLPFETISGPPLSPFRVK